MGLFTKYNSTAPTATDKQFIEFQSDVNGNLKNTHATLNAGEDLTRNTQDTTYKGTSTRITTAATTVCDTGAGNLKRVFVEVALTGTATIYDNIVGSGTILTILPATLPAGSYEFNFEYETGCTVVTTNADKLVVVTGV